MEQKRFLRSLFNVRMPGRINEDFLNSHNGKILYLELGVGYNTPGIIKYPFWQMTADNPDAVYACVNFGEAVCPEDIMAQAICIDGDIGTVIDELRM